MTCDIYLCRGNTLIDRIISRVTGSPVTHIVMEINDCMIMDTGWLGVVVSDVRYKNNFIRKRYMGLTQKQIDNIIEYMATTLGKGYDYKQLLSVGLFKLFGVKLFDDDTEKFICVELVVDAFFHVGIDIVPHIQDSLYATPGDLDTSPVLTTI